MSCKLRPQRWRENTWGAAGLPGAVMMRAVAATRQGAFGTTGGTVDMLLRGLRTAQVVENPAMFSLRNHQKKPLPW